MKDFGSFEEDSALKKMNRVLEHRGPDDQGYWLSKDRKVGLAHRRLSILDLSKAGHQPMQNTSGNTIVFNGEIYNYQNLRKQFIKTELQSTTDTEVLLEMFSSEGLDSLPRINGMFAFAFWESASQRLTLARDRVGIKPLYYTTKNGIFAFASEIRALLTLPWIKAEIDETALYDFLSFNQNVSYQTMFKGIKKLPQGSTITADRHGISEPTPFWKFSYNDDLNTIDENEARDLVYRELQTSVSDQMISDVPIGAFLSGGVDSSYLVGLMSERSSHPVRTFSIGFEGASRYDETRYARSVSRLFKTDHTEHIVRAKDMRDFLPSIAEVFDEPLADPTCIPIYFISELAKQSDTKVILTGDGADECFYGYRRWGQYAKIRRYSKTYLSSPKWLRQGIAKAYSAYRSSGPLFESLVNAVNGKDFTFGVPGFKDSVKNSCLSSEYLDRMSHNSVDEEKRRSEAEFLRAIQGSLTRGDIDRLCYSGFRSAVPDKYCFRSDRLGMAHSIELRVPFLDNKMVDLSLNLPGRLKFKKGIPKYVLKRSAEKLLPEEILYRNKMGFCVPVKEWGGGVMIGYIEDNLRKFCNETGYFNEEGIRSILSRSIAGNTDYAFALWNLYFLIQWFNRWML